MRDQIHKVVLTGGPCGGKTSCKSYLKDKLEREGYRVFLVPEVATVLSKGGAPFPDFSEEAKEYEYNYVMTQVGLERTFESLAHLTGEPSVIICDRGTVDAAAYISEEAWQELFHLLNNDWPATDISSARYDMVIHLVTAAIGAEAFYTTGNNEARHETLEQAREMDHRFREVWSDHPRRMIIENEGDFEVKMYRMWVHLQDYLGI